jgi:PIN domain nuclease of toxin-antitoxin system
VRSTGLPPLHADPCDRMIIATAQLRNLCILTPDPLILAYPDTRAEW